MSESLADNRRAYAPGIILALTFVYVVPLVVTFGTPSDYPFGTMLASLGATLGILTLSLCVVTLGASVSPIHAARRPDGAMIWRLVVLFCVLPAFAVIFNEIKRVLPLLAFWDIDHPLMVLECGLGVCPHEFITPWLFVPGIFDAAGFFYNAVWPVVFALGVPAYLVIFGRDQQRAAHFFTAYILCWIVLGAVTATLAFSVGPAFVNILSDANAYDALLDQLARASNNALAPVSVFDAIEIFREVYSPDKLQPPGLSMSAMPSMHMSMVALVWCYTRTSGPVVHALSTIMVVIIGVVGVGVGWHYASDMLAAFGLTCVIWWLTGRYLPRVCASRTMTCTLTRPLNSLRVGSPSTYTSLPSTSRSPAV